MNKNKIYSVVIITIVLSLVGAFFASVYAWLNITLGVDTLVSVILSAFGFLTVGYGFLRTLKLIK